MTAPRPPRSKRATPKRVSRPLATREEAAMAEPEPAVTLIVGTDTGVGKTFITSALARAVRAAGQSVVAVKPFETGCEEEPRPDEDGVRLAAATGPSGALRALLRLYGGDEVLDAARAALPQRPLVREALDQLQWLATHLRAAFPALRIGFDLSDMSGYAYYSGARFAVYGAGSSDALARGGRYDEVGAVFGRNRPAVGFSLDLKALAEVACASPLPSAVRAPWGEDPELRAAVRRLREAGETVVAMLPGHDLEAQVFDCDRELVKEGGRWLLHALPSPTVL